MLLSKLDNHLLLLDAIKSGLADVIGALAQITVGFGAKDVSTASFDAMGFNQADFN